MLNRPMRSRLSFLLAAGAGACLSSYASADVVTLSGGGVIHGKLAHAATEQVSVQTASGAVIVVEKSTVKNVKKGSVSAPSSTTGRHASAKAQLTDAEQVWVPKIRRLVGRLASDDAPKRAHARAELLRIDDPDAIPGLQQALAYDSRDDVRRLFVVILKDIPGSRAVRSIVEQSLGDPSPTVRAEAIQAIGVQRAPNARVLYAAALRCGDPFLIQRSAVALREIGDPEHVSVPALIDNLTYASSYRVLAQPGCVHDSVRIGPKPADHYTSTEPELGADYGRWYYKKSAPWGGAPTQPARVGAPALAGGPTGIPTTTSRQPPARLAEIHTPYGYTEPKMRDIVIEDYHPQILDTLRSITGKDFALNRDAWRSWLQTEQTNRELQSHAADAKPVAR